MPRKALTKGALDGKFLSGVVCLGELHKTLTSEAAVDVRQNAEPSKEKRRVWLREVIKRCF
jgi:hypothetical protein